MDDRIGHGPTDQSSEAASGAEPGNAVQQVSGQDITRLIDIAVQHHTQGRLPEAEALYRQILKADPNQPVALHLLGVIAHQVGKHDVAVELISQALANKPDFAEAHNNLGLALRAMGRLDQAVGSHVKAIAINPGFADAHYALGNALTDQWKLHEAAASYEKAIQFRPEFLAAHNNLGLALQKIGKLDEAAASFRKALAIAPRFAEAHNNLAIALQSVGELDDARASANEALAIKPDFAAAHYNRHSLLLSGHDVGPAIASMERAVECEPNNKTYRFTLGMLQDYSGNAQAAAAQFDAVESEDYPNRVKLDAKLDAWRYLKSASGDLPPIIGSSIQAFEIGLGAAAVDGLVLEFGVRFGGSIRQISRLAGQDVHGFDSFEGLPESWHNAPKGSYSTQNVIPAVPDTVTLHQGWFEDTLPGFVEDHAGPVRFMNVDCDIYSSTMTIFEHLGPRIVPGTVIVFDEYIGYEKWRDHEFKAFQECVDAHGWRYEYLCFSFVTRQVAVRIL